MSSAGNATDRTCEDRETLAARLAGDQLLAPGKTSQMIAASDQHAIGDHYPSRV
jgi:hypothetical protein